MDTSLPVQNLPVSKPPVNTAGEEMLWLITKSLREPKVIMDFIGLNQFILSEDMKKVVIDWFYSLAEGTDDTARRNM